MYTYIYICRYIYTYVYNYIYMQYYTVLQIIRLRQVRNVGHLKIQLSTFGQSQEAFRIYKDWEIENSATTIWQFKMQCRRWI